MTETTIRLKLPIRRVLLADRIAPPLEWVRQHHHRLAQHTIAESHAEESQAAIGRLDRAAESERRCDDETRLREHRVELDQVIGQLRSAAKMLHTQWEQVLPELQQAIVELAHTIAAKLILDKLAADEFPIQNLVHEVVGRLSTSEPVIVRLHPDDFTLWQRHLEQQISEGIGANIRVQADATLARGDCQATAGEITIVYELRRQIEDLRQQLVSAVNGHDA